MIVVRRRLWPVLAGNLSALVWLVSISAAFGELPSPRLDLIFPLGGGAGTSVEVEVVGADLEQADKLHFDHPGLSAEPVSGKERHFRITVAPDVPAGTYDAWLVGRFGITNPRLFAVSQGLQDIAEQEPNNQRKEAQSIPLNSVVHGRSDSNDQDVYRLTLNKDQRVTISCQAGKLDSLMDATLTLSLPEGAPVASNGDYHGRDSFLDFVVPHAGDYVLTVHDLSYRGGYPYRLVVSDHPQLENVFPRAVKSGESTEVVALGRNLGAGALGSRWSWGDLRLDEKRYVVTAPADLLAINGFRFREHPTDHTVLPTASTCTLTGFQFLPPQPDMAGPQTMLLCDEPISLESEPNSEIGSAQKIMLPTVMNARFDEPRDADWYEFETTSGGTYAFEVYCERLHGRADPYLVVQDEQGNRVAELDDFGHRINAFDGHLRDPSGAVNLAEKKKYRVLVQDRYRRGGARFQYVLRIRQATPDFYAAVIHHQNPGPGGTTVRRGGAAYLDVILHMTEGFSGPVTLTAEQLPEGLHARPTTINETRGVFVLWADENAPEGVTPVKLTATGLRGDQLLRREVRPYCRVWTDPGMNSSRPMRELPVAVRESAPFSLRWGQEEVAVEAGKMAEVRLLLTRRWPDFKNNVTVLPLAFPGPLKMANFEFAGEQTELLLRIETQAGIRPGNYTVAVVGQAQVPFSKNPQETNRPNTLVSLSSEPLTLRVQKQD